MFEPISSSRFLHCVRDRVVSMNNQQHTKDKSKEIDTADQHAREAEKSAEETHEPAAGAHDAEKA